MARPVADPKGGSSLWDLKVHSMSRDYFAIANPFTLGPPSSQGVRIEKLRVLPPDLKDLGHKVFLLYYPALSLKGPE